MLPFLLGCMGSTEVTLGTDLFSSCLQETWAASYLASLRQSGWRNTAIKMRTARRWAGMNTTFVLDHLAQNCCNHACPQIRLPFSLEKWGISHFWLNVWCPVCAPALVAHSCTALWKYSVSELFPWVSHLYLLTGGHFDREHITQSDYILTLPS